MPTLEERIDDIRAVLDDLGVPRAAILGQGYGTPIALLFGATYPDRTSSLVLYSPNAKAGLKTDDYPWGSTAEEQAAWREHSLRMWGTSEFAAEWLGPARTFGRRRRPRRRMDGTRSARVGQPDVPRTRR